MLVLPELHRSQQQEWQQQSTAEHECTTGAAADACVAASKWQEAGRSCIFVQHTCLHV